MNKEWNIYKILYWDIGEPDKIVYVEAKGKNDAKRRFFESFRESCFVKGVDKLDIIWVGQSPIGQETE